MAGHEIRTKVVSIIAEQLNKSAAELTDATTIDSLNADSLDRVEILMRIEEAFDVTLPDDKVEAITTVGDYIRCVEEARL